VQDLLNLGADARMNWPGRPADNWRWRATAEQIDSPLFERLRDLTRQTGRSDHGAWKARIGVSP
jgi:4-alpha-glucanotransferase